MKTMILLTGMALYAAVWLAFPAESANDALQKGLFEEEANRNLEAAIRAYESVVNQYEVRRTAAATAVFRLGECYRKQGKTNEAAAQYQRILAEFGDQAALAKLSRENLGVVAPQLAAEGRQPVALPPAPAAKAPSSPAALERQHEFLVQELKLLEDQLVSTLKLIENGRAGQVEAIPVQREILSLKRQLADVEEALEAPPRTDTAAAPGASPGVDSPAAPSEEAAELQRIKVMIRNSPDLVNARNSTGSGGTLLHAAATKGYLTVAQLLLENHAEVNARDNGGAAPLCAAAECGHRSLCELLLANGAEVNAADQFARTPLHRAAENGFVAVAQVLLSKGADANAKGYVLSPAEASLRLEEQYRLAVTPLHLAAIGGSRPMAELLLSKGADINAQSQGGATPLMLAVKENQRAVAEALLARGASLEAQEKQGHTALQVAAINQRLELARLLLDHKAEVNAKGEGKGGKKDWTALHQAVENYDADMVALLLERGADPNAQTSTGATALHQAARDSERDKTARANSGRVIQALLAGKADPNLRDAQGNPPLAYALDPSKRDIALLLLDNGADASVKASDGAARHDWPLLLVAAGWPTNDTVRLLLERGADVNAATKDGWTPLHEAAKQGDLEFVKLILARKPNLNAAVSPQKAAADANSESWPGGPGPQYAHLYPSYFAVSERTTAADCGGMTPLHVAVGRSSQLEIVELLLNQGANIEARDALGRTPLHLAVGRQDRKMVELLLEHKADPNAKDQAGVTPLVLLQRPGAAQGVLRRAAAGSQGGFFVGNPAEIFELLRKHGAESQSAPPPGAALPPPQPNAGADRSIPTPAPRPVGTPPQPEGQPTPR